MAQEMLFDVSWAFVLFATPPFHCFPFIPLSFRLPIVSCCLVIALLLCLP
jgi:hypothetical protein